MRPGSARSTWRWSIEILYENDVPSLSHVAATRRRSAIPYATWRLHMTTAATTDRIEKKTVLRAPRSRVWRALSDAKEFGTWFGVKLGGTFAEGATLRGQITIPGYDHVTMEVIVERMEPERY